jgi:hypothetical protein
MASRSTSSDRDLRGDHAPALNSARSGSVDISTSDRNGDCEEQVPFLTTSDAPQSRISQSHFSARCISIIISLAKNGLFRQLLLLAFLFSVCWCMIFVFFLPVMDPSDRERCPSQFDSFQKLCCNFSKYAHACESVSTWALNTEGCAVNQLIAIHLRTSCFTFPTPAFSHVTSMGGGTGSRFPSP